MFSELNKKDYRKSNIWKRNQRNSKEVAIKKVNMCSSC